MQYVDATKLRAYFFGNMYISDIQQGIQAAHVVTKMFAAYPAEGYSDADTLHDWARAGVTKILLNGGYQLTLQKVHSIFEAVGSRLSLPFMQFHEEVDALNGALTSVGIVVPEEVYDMDVHHPSIGPHVIFPLSNALGITSPNDYPPSAVFQASLRLRDVEYGTSSVDKIYKFIFETLDVDGLSELELMYLLHRTLKSCRLA
jgi:peptidyl-tRNA hydrolase